MIPRQVQLPCPDCSAAPDDEGSLAHVEGCPLAAALDALMDSDREFFERHPGLTERRREPSWVEGAEMKMMGSFPNVPGELCGEVIVRLLGPGLRARDFSETWFYVEGPPR